MKKQACKKPTLHIAVIVAEKFRGLATLDPEVILSRRTRGDWAAFMGFDLSRVVEQARQARVDWEAQGAPEYGPYIILVGTLDWKAEFPIEFTLKPLGGSK